MLSSYVTPAYINALETIAQTETTEGPGLRKTTWLE